MTDCPIANFAKVDDILWRGARPGPAGAAWLVGEGVRSVVNLELSDEDTPPFAPFPAVILRHLPDWEPLATVHAIEDQHIHQALAAIRELPKPIYMHCRQGENRTGLAVAAYRLIERRDPLDLVLTELRSFQGFWQQADEAYVRSLAERISKFA